MVLGVGPLGFNSINSAVHSSTGMYQKLKTVFAGRSGDSLAPGLFETRPGGANTASTSGWILASGSKCAPSADSGSVHDFSTSFAPAYSSGSSLLVSASAFSIAFYLSNIGESDLSSCVLCAPLGHYP